MLTNVMTIEELEALTELLMVSDPWPLEPWSKDVLNNYADGMAQVLGYDDWIDAYHKLGNKASDHAFSGSF
jgi:hypothetical protein